MPHLMVQYTPNIETDYDAFCLTLLRTLLTIRDRDDRPVYPASGTRVMAFPATACAVGDGNGEYGYMFLLLRIFEGRTALVVQQTGDSLMDAVRHHIEAELRRLPMGIALNIEETPRLRAGPVRLAYQGFHNSLRELF